MKTLINASKHEIPLDINIGFGEHVSICCSEIGQAAILEYTDQHIIDLPDLFDDFISTNTDDNEYIENFLSILVKYSSICTRLLNRKLESPIEEMFWQAAAGKLHHLTYQVPIKKYRVDFAFQSLKIAIEVDGHEYHKTKKQRTHDAERERYLMEQGWEVIRFTGTEVYKDAEKCVDQVRQLVWELKSPEWARPSF